ncbi:MAG TPA: 3-phosphoserine/phosphohydroxythreonine transaminase [bacterium]|nr:3-phosphoserine/phosphohydroxythreonine transaminase [Myxococcales bacterium]OQA61959.1 MAG: Phosphoserine aminotransferase [bacterium ADurb.Bin270]HPW44895.1 3-phosphoserine/phosphohydroxythreonine transaminase [bacterium]HQC51035.1 3-phosphoserine/phosphohydroxythreonine transaminase [bacterium]HQG13266.1 3-phosphoserine/phosphohydroxythreonine transaminase [bacterium]
MSERFSYNFGAGPSVVPHEVLDAAVAELSRKDSQSILEIHHRSTRFKNLLEECESLSRELLGIPKNYRFLILPGGGRMQFAMIPMNLLEGSADYAITGLWSKKAMEEAEKVGNVRVAYSSEDAFFSKVPLPEEIEIDGTASYLHITSNNTVYGTQYYEFPDAGEPPLIADMSSDLFTRDVDVSNFALIYAAFQKNCGIAGAAVVIIRDDLLERNPRILPDFLRYGIHANHGSLFNTPPLFSIFIFREMLRWIKRSGGVEMLGRSNDEKSSLIYEVIDSSDFYTGAAEKGSRSKVNVVFDLSDDKITKLFIERAESLGLLGLSGHRSRGGIRASLYNAMPVSGAHALAEFMREFEKRS